jgi:hypothetical protein
MLQVHKKQQGKDYLEAPLVPVAITAGGIGKAMLRPGWQIVPYSIDSSHDSLLVLCRT